MPRKNGPKRTDSRRNVPKLIREMDARLDARLAELEKGIAESVEEVAENAVPELVRAEMRGLFVRWTDDLEPK